MKLAWIVVPTVLAFAIYQVWTFPIDFEIVVDPQEMEEMSPELHEKLEPFLNSLVKSEHDSMLVQAKLFEAAMSKSRHIQGFKLECALFVFFRSHKRCHESL